MTRPRLRIGRHLLPGAIAVVLFVVLAGTFVRAPFGDADGFEGSVTESIGFALLNLDLDGALTGIPSEGFLVALLLLALALDAALDGAIHLARRDERSNVAGDDGGER